MYYSIGKYGHLRLNYLKEHKRVLYTELLLDGKLSKHLALIDEDAKKRVPGVGDIVKTPTCDRCKVITADYLREIIKTENDGTIEQWNANEVIKIKSSKNKEEKPVRYQP